MIIQLKDLYDSGHDNLYLFIMWTGHWSSLSKNIWDYISEANPLIFTVYCKARYYV